MDSSSFNSTRLSLAIVDLPLTPFGMSSPFKKETEVENQNLAQFRVDHYTDYCSPKLSRDIRNLPDRKSKISSPETPTPSSINFKNVNFMRRKLKTGQSAINNSFVKKDILFENPTDIISVSCEPIKHVENRLSESYLTDIEDGSFVEFQQTSVKPDFQVIIPKPKLYYTCSSQNETEFSTSSKSPIADVGFQKFVDKVVDPVFLSNTIQVENLVNKHAKEFKVDETVIAASRDILHRNNYKYFRMNSTLNAGGIGAQEELPDISSLTLHDLPYPSKDPNIDIVSAELSNEESSSGNVKIHGKKGCSSDHNDSIDTVHIPLSQHSLISEDISLLCPDNKVSKQRFAMDPSFHEPVKSQNKALVLQNQANAESCLLKNIGHIREWIVTSPFKNSSFGSSFLDKNNADPNLSKVNLLPNDHTLNASPESHLKLSYDIIPHPNDSLVDNEVNVLNTENIQTKIFVNNHVISNKNNGSSCIKDLNKENSFNKLGIAENNWHSNGLTDESVIYSSDDRSILPSLGSSRKSLSTPNLQSCNFGKKSCTSVKKTGKEIFSWSRFPGTSLQDKRKGIYETGFPDNEKNSKSNPNLNEDYHCTRPAVGHISDHKDKQQEKSFTKALSNSDTELLNGLNGFDKGSAEIIPKTLKNVEKKIAMPTKMINPKSSIKYNILSNSPDLSITGKIKCSKKYNKTKIPTFELSSDSDDKDENLSGIIPTSRTEIEPLTLKITRSTTEKPKELYIISDSSSDDSHVKGWNQSKRKKYSKKKTKQSSILVNSERSKNDATNKVRPEYVSSDSNNDDNFETYLKGWKKSSGTGKNKHSNKNIKESSFLVDSDVSGDDTTFYLQYDNKENVQNCLNSSKKSIIYKTMEEKVVENDLAVCTPISPHIYLHTSETNKEFKNNNVIQTPIYNKNSGKSNLLELSSDSESDSYINIFKSKTKPQVPRMKLVNNLPTSLPSDSESDSYVNIFKSKKKPKVPRMKLISSLPTPLPSLNKISKTLTFLASLSLESPFINANLEALTYLRNFKKNKESLTEKLFVCFNDHIFNKKLPQDMKITWNMRLTKTAGYCFYQAPRATSSQVFQRSARIELSVKVCDSPARLRDTLIHELCHAATWIITGVKEHHGKYWKGWASKAMMTFPELSTISRCHNYEVNCKYTYRCVACGRSVGRHSKSINLEREFCGFCHGKLELIVNNVKKHTEQSLNLVPKTPNTFALFVKENYSSVKKSQSDLKHGDVMKHLGKQFRNLKTN